MKKQLVIIGIIALLVCVGLLSGCTNTTIESDNEKKIKPEQEPQKETDYRSLFFGKWHALGNQGDEYYETITFYSDGLLETTRRGHSFPGEWRANETTIYMNIDGPYRWGYYDYTFTNSETFILTTLGITYKKS